MKYDERLKVIPKITTEALAASLLPELDGLDKLRVTLDEGRKLSELHEAQQAGAVESLTPQQRKGKLTNKLRAIMEAFAQKPFLDEFAGENKVTETEIRKALSDADTVQHNKLMQSLRTVVYDSDLKIPGRTNAISREVDEALGDLLKGGAYDDRKLAQVVEELFALEGRAAGNATAGKFAAMEVPTADLPDDNTPDNSVSVDTAVASIGTASQSEDDKKAAQELAKKFKDAQKEVVATMADSLISH